MSKLTSRRRFLETTAAVAAGTFAGGVHAGGSDLLKVGLIGCGGRGSGAAVQALKADKNVKLWAIGDIRALQANVLRGRIWMFPREQGWSDMEWQMRNWYYFTWLSGDFNVEQHVHNLDVCAWIMRDQYPTKCIGMGGRQVRVGTEYGNIYDHFAVTYEYDNGVKIFSNTRQQVNCHGDMKVYALGANGRAVISE